MGYGARKSKVCRLKGKRKERTTKKSVLFFGEGNTEKAFLDYIHQLYTTHKGNKTVQRGGGRGGSHVDILQQALLYKCHSSDFDEIYVLLDDDCKSIQCKEAVQKAKARLKKVPQRRRVPVWCIYSEPVCVEGVFLNWLGEKVPTNAKACKKVFYEKYLTEKDKLVSKAYAKIFPRKFLDKARHDSAILHSIISVFE